MEAGAPVHPPVPMAMYPLLATVLLTVGIVAAALFFLYQVTTTRYSRKIAFEGLLGLSASVALGLGTLFLLLWGQQMQMQMQQVPGGQGAEQQAWRLGMQLLLRDLELWCTCDARKSSSGISAAQ
uniref:Dolichyl-diphosphooligosaccharide-protein glycosyltransferase subunit OST5 n=1 Tax=Tetradesmus obliquus TaxID=3088 RepID=A0A383V929_TETOB|eukprot:jgi/Sobl393_1/11060/SZX62078.1